MSTKETFRDKAQRWIARLLPRWLVYHCMLRAWDEYPWPEDKSAWGIKMLRVMDFWAGFTDEVILDEPETNVPAK